MPINFHVFIKCNIYYIYNKYINHKKYLLIHLKIIMIHLTQ